MTPAPKRLLIQNARLITTRQPGQTGWLLTEGEKIRSIGFGQTPDFADEASLMRVDGRSKNLPGQ